MARDRLPEFIQAYEKITMCVFFKRMNQADDRLDPQQIDSDGILIQFYFLMRVHSMFYTGPGQEINEIMRRGSQSKEVRKLNLISSGKLHISI